MGLQVKSVSGRNGDERDEGEKQQEEELGSQVRLVRLPCMIKRSWGLRLSRLINQIPLANEGGAAGGRREGGGGGGGRGREKKR